eukprot:3419470-Prymnesium_polylepis.1
MLADWASEWKVIEVKSPTAIEICDALFKLPPLEWSRITPFQDRTVVLMCQRLLPVADPRSGPHLPARRRQLQASQGPNDSQSALQSAQPWGERTGRGAECNLAGVAAGGRSSAGGRSGRVRPHARLPERPNVGAQPRVVCGRDQRRDAGGPAPTAMSRVSISHRPRKFAPRTRLQEDHRHDAGGRSRPTFTARLRSRSRGGSCVSRGSLTWQRGWWCECLEGQLKYLKVQRVP